jgi:GntR family transcriptional regulator
MARSMRHESVRNAAPTGAPAAQPQERPAAGLVIDHRSAVPLWHQLSEGIRRMIASGFYKTGDTLPTEHEWSKRYGLSSTTVRRALGELVHDELLERKAGRGTFVRSPRVTRDLRKVLGFTENMVEMGLVPSTRVLSKEIVPASELAREKLGLRSRTRVLRLERLRLGNDIPMMLETRQVRLDLCPGIVDQDLTVSLWSVFERAYGLKPRRHAQSLSMGRASDRASALLGIPAGAPVFLVRGVTYLGDGAAIECEESTYRADRYEFSFEATT